MSCIVVVSWKPAIKPDVKSVSREKLSGPYREINANRKNKIIEESYLTHNNNNTNLASTKNKKKYACDNPTVRQFVTLLT